MKNPLKVNLSRRLQALTKFILPGKPVADIGSDHAYLPLYLIKEDLVPFVIATELTQGPWQKAKNLIEFHQLREKIDLRLGDGLHPLKKGEVSTVVIAGMGAKTIIHILESNLDLLSSVERLVLQPMTEIPVLRNWLCQNNWPLIDEELIEEAGYFYLILVAEKGEGAQLSPIELELGPILLAKKHPLLERYGKELAQREKIVLKKLEEKDSLRAQKQKQIAEANLKRLTEVWKWE